MNNKLIRTNTFWYKVRNFFQSIFKKKQYNDEYKTQEDLKESKFSTSLRETIIEHNKVQSLANQLLGGELGCSELTDLQVDELIIYFKSDIKNLDNELLRIKRHIVEMKQQLQ